MTDIFKKERPMCDKAYCAANMNGRCVHFTCPMTNPEYKSPERVATEIEQQMKAQLDLERQLKQLKDNE